LEKFKPGMLVKIEFMDRTMPSDVAEHLREVGYVEVRQ